VGQIKESEWLYKKPVFAYPLRENLASFPKILTPVDT
jgi:hypothetical protein